MPSRTARLSKKGCGFATPECRAQRDVAVHPRPAPPPPLLAAPRLSTTALGDLEIRWVVSPVPAHPWTGAGRLVYLGHPAMPRRRALTEAQLESLLALPTTEAELVRHWTLDRADLAAVDRRRGGHNQFGFALQLCALRYPGRLPRSGELIPAEALRFAATQPGAEPEALASYAARFQTRYEQLDALRRCSASPSWACPNGARSWLGCCQWRWPPRVPPP